MLAWNSVKLRSWHLISSLHCKWKGEKWNLWHLFIYLFGSKITLDSDWSHEIKRHTLELLLGRNAMRNLESALKKRGITLPTKVCTVRMGFPGSSAGKESACNSGDSGSIPGSGRSPAEGNGYPLHYSGLQNPHCQRNLAGYSPWGHKEWYMIEWLNSNSSVK